MWPAHTMAGGETSLLLASLKQASPVIEELLKSRVLFVSGLIDQSLSDHVIASLLYFDRDAPDKDVYLFINSTGGYVTPGMAIHDTIRLIRPDVVTVCIGWAMSMGALILSSGTKGKRYALPHANIMLHQPIGGTMGQASDVEIHAKEIVRVRKMLNDIIAENTGQPVEKVAQDTDRDRYMTAEEAVEYGVIDGLLTRMPA